MPIIYVTKARNRYTFLHFLIDFTLIFLTGGLWLIWIVVRYLANH